MLYKTELQKVIKPVNCAVDEIFSEAFDNQKYENDMLLIFEHGFFNDDPDWVKFAQKENLNYAMIGPRHEGYAEHTHYEFYDLYRQQVEEDHNRFVKRMGGQEKAETAERTSIHLELMVYLKFWEADMLIKKLYQLVRLANGEPYDWFFKIRNFDKGRNQIIRNEIRDKSGSISPIFAKLVRETYSNQIRNSVGHSQYSFIGRHIHFNNKEESKYHKLHGLSFEEWAPYIHKVIWMYNAMIRNEKKYMQHYIDKATGKHYGLRLKVPTNDKALTDGWYKYDPNIRSWMWYYQWNDERKSREIKKMLKMGR